MAAVDHPSAQGVFNVTDGDYSSTTAYLQLTAAAAGIEPPALISKAEAREKIPAGMLSFLLESRRVDNRRMLAELGLQLQYPTLQSGVLASLAEMRQAAGGSRTMTSFPQSRHGRHSRHCCERRARSPSSASRTTPSGRASA